MGYHINQCKRSVELNNKQWEWKQVTICYSNEKLPQSEITSCLCFLMMLKKSNYIS